MQHLRLLAPRRHWAGAPELRRGAGTHRSSASSAGRNIACRRLGKFQVPAHTELDRADTGLVVRWVLPQGVGDTRWMGISRLPVEGEAHHGKHGLGAAAENAAGLARQIGWHCNPLYSGGDPGRWAHTHYCVWPVMIGLPRPRSKPTPRQARQRGGIRRSSGRPHNIPLPPIRLLRVPFCRGGIQGRPVRDMPSLGIQPVPIPHPITKPHG